MFELSILIITVISGFLIVYSHAIFPLILKMLRRRGVENSCSAAQTITKYPSITIVVPAYNEEAFIADKIINLAALDYPSDKLKVIVYCDGCTDYTVAAAEGAIYSNLCRDLDIE